MLHADICDGFECLFRIDSAGRIGGVIEDDGLGLFVDKWAIIFLIHIKKEVNSLAGDLLRHDAMTFMTLVAIMNKNTICNVCMCFSLKIVNINNLIIGGIDTIDSSLSNTITISKFVI